MTIAGMRGPDGKVIGFGGITRKHVDADFSTGVLPATVTVPVGTATFGALPTTTGTPAGGLGAVGYRQVASGAASSNEGQVQAQPILRTADFRTIRGRVQGLGFHANNPLAGFYVRFRGSNNMVSFGQEYGAQTATVLRYSESAVNTQFNVLHRGVSRATRNHTIEIGMSLPLKEAWVSVGDSKPLTFPIAASIDHNVRFQVGVITREAAAHWLQLCTMELWGEHH